MRRLLAGCAAALWATTAPAAALRYCDRPAEASPAEQDRLRKAYAEAYSSFFAETLPDNGVPCRFTVHLTDVPDKAASYEFYSTALFQRALQ